MTPETTPPPPGSPFKRLVFQLLGYTWVAALGLTVDFGTLILLTSVAGAPYLLGAAVGFTLGLIVTYVLSERFVFGGPKLPHAWLRFALFGAIGLVGLGLLELIMWGLVDGLGLGYVLAKILATAVVYLWNFFARRTMYR